MRVSRKKPIRSILSEHRGLGDLASVPFASRSLLVCSGPLAAAGTTHAGAAAGRRVRRTTTAEEADRMGGMAGPQLRRSLSEFFFFCRAT